MGSYDAGYGTWYLEDLVGKKRAKDIWFCNPKIKAFQALEMGLINRVVADDKLTEETRTYALEVAQRGSFALASIKGAFNARHGGVSGLGRIRTWAPRSRPTASDSSRITHDLLLRPYLDSEESKELRSAFAERRAPDTDKFGH